MYTSCDSVEGMNSDENCRFDKKIFKLKHFHSLLLLQQQIQPPNFSPILSKKVSLYFWTIGCNLGGCIGYSVKEFIFAQVFPLLEKSQLEIYGTFYLFGSILLLFLPVIYFIVPETKDVALELVPTFFTPVKTIFYVDIDYR